MAELKRVLGFWPLLALSITSILGTTLYFSPSVGAIYSGVSSILAWIALTIVAIYISLFFGELVAMFPKAGGVYEFSKQTYGRFTSFLVAWIAWLLGNLMTALLIVAAINYLIPDPTKFLLKLGISVLFIITLNVVAFFGVEQSAYAQVVFAFITIGLIFAIVAPGIVKMDYGVTKNLFATSLTPIFITIFILAEGFFGWESATYLSEETKNPEKVIPKALIIGTIIVGIISILSALVSFGFIPIRNLIQSPAPLIDVATNIYGVGVKQIFGIGVFLSLIGAAASGIVTMPRLILALARDKLFIAQFADVHEKYRTPYKAIIFQTIISLIIFGMAFGNYNNLLLLVVPMGFMMYGFIILAVLILRIKKPHLKRTFRVPFGKIGSVLVILFFAALFIAWITSEPSAVRILKLELSFISVGIPIYLLLTLYYDPDAIVRVNDKFAYLTLLTEKFILPKRIKKQLLKMVGDIKNKTILEFGCSVGTLTLPLAEATKPYGKVFATDLSTKDLVITNKRLNKKGHSHVTIIHDEHQVNRVHPEIPNVDTIISVGMMGYLQDVKKVLSEMRDLLPHGGKIVLMDYVDFFKVIPNVEWLTDNDTIKKLFTEAGFEIFITRKKGLFWNYVFVNGVKI